MMTTFGLLLLGGFIFLMMRGGCGGHMAHSHASHGGHPGGTNHALELSGSVDPVCGMSVAAGQGYAENVAGRQYRFCSRACLDQFDGNPGRYLTHG